MNCDFQKTDRTHKSGLPYWLCSREGCGNRCVSADGVCTTACRSGVVVEVTKQVVAEIKPKAGCKPCEKARQYKAAIAAKMAELKRADPT